MSCATSGCGKPSYNGKPGEYCGRTCRTRTLSSSFGSLGGSTCPAPACGKPSFDGKPGSYCGKSCRARNLTAEAPAPAAPAPVLCSASACGKPSYNGKPGEYCSMPCRMSNQGCTKLDPTNFLYKSVFEQFDKTWDPEGTAMMGKPVVKEIWQVGLPHLVAKHDDYCKAIGDVPLFHSGKNPGNQQRRFHGTRIACDWNGAPCDKENCPACGIIKTGFQMKFARKGSAFFGLGIYNTSTSSGACRYCRGRMPDNMIVKGVVIVLGVACGKPSMVEGKDLTDNSMEDSEGCPDGCHSRIVNNPAGSKSYVDHSGAHGEPLLKTENEIVVFDDAATVPKYLIIFESTTPI